MEVKIRKVKNGYVLNIDKVGEYIARDEEEVGQIVVKALKDERDKLENVEGAKPLEP